MGWEPWKFLVSDGLRRLFVGSLFGEMRPPRRPPPASRIDARTHALLALADVLTEARFTDPRESAAVEYRLPAKHILVESPDDADTALLFPRIVFTPGEATYLPFGTVPTVFEHTRDRFGLGTVVVCSSEYEEQVGVELWATTRAQRRMLAAGVEEVLTGMQERSPGLLLRLPRYYGETASYQLVRRMNVDDEDAQRRRRRADITISMRVNVVRLVNAQTLRPAVAVYVSDEAGPVGRG